MKSRISLPAFFLFAVTSPTVIAGTHASEPAKGVLITPDPSPSRWRLGVGYAPLVGLKTEFSGLGNFSPTFPTQPLGGGVDYNYDDGFVRVDSSGNLGGETWNWGYENASQIDPAGLGSVDYTLTRGVADGSADEDGGGEMGVEVFGYLDMGAASIIPMLEKRGATWGFRGGFNYNHVDVDKQRHPLIQHHHPDRSIQPQWHGPAAGALPGRFLRWSWPTDRRFSVPLVRPGRIGADLRLTGAGRPSQRLQSRKLSRTAGLHQFQLDVRGRSERRHRVGFLRFPVEHERRPVWAPAPAREVIPRRACFPGSIWVSRRFTS